jgi:hypothetical protein
MPKAEEFDPGLVMFTFVFPGPPAPIVTEYPVAEADTEPERIPPAPPPAEPWLPVQPPPPPPATTKYSRLLYVLLVEETVKVPLPVKVWYL